jgi:hypothetical protein
LSSEQPLSSSVMCSLLSNLVMARHANQHRITSCSQGSHVFHCGSPSAPSGRRKSYMPLNRHICLTHIHLLQVPPHLLVHSAVSPLPFYTYGRHTHVLFHINVMLHGILGDNSHGFVHGIRGAMSVELTPYYVQLLICLWLFIFSYLQHKQNNFSWMGYRS